MPTRGPAAGGSRMDDTDNEAFASLDELKSMVVATLDQPGGQGAAIKLVCTACQEMIPTDGAAISIKGSGTWETLYATGTTMGWIESTQATLGEGPSFEAVKTRRPVLMPDTHGADAASTWPFFAAEMATQPVGAFFAFPLQIGAISIGTLDLYRTATGWFENDALTMALRLVDLATLALLWPPFGTPSLNAEDKWPSVLPPHRSTVHQATGMLIAHFQISAEQALTRLHGYAFARGQLVEDVPAT